MMVFAVIPHGFKRNHCRYITCVDFISKIVHSTGMECCHFDEILAVHGALSFCQCVNMVVWDVRGSWWRHGMETFSALLALCAGNSPVTGEFPLQRPVTRSFCRQSIHWCFETQSRLLWRHCNVAGSTEHSTVFSQQDIVWEQTQSNNRLFLVKIRLGIKLLLE